ncbi:MAG: hypothetical protein IAE78_33685 [Myxococcus sp.]|nr:hypothetical protein [Myxococcus sp.]
MTSGYDGAMLLPYLALLAAAPGATIAVPTVVAEDKALIEALNPIVAGEVRARAPAGSSVLTSSDIAVAIGNERQRALLGCDTSDCLAEIGAALSADEQVITSISVLASGVTGTQYTVEVRRLSGASMTRLGSGLVEVCGGGSRLADAVRGAVALAFGSPSNFAGGERCAPFWTVPTMIAGGGLAAAGTVGIAWGLSTKFAFDAQQLPGAAQTVSRADAMLAQTLFVTGLVTGAVGVGLIVASTARLLWQPAAPVAISVAFVHGVTVVVVGGSL